MDKKFENKIKEIPTLFTHKHAHIIYGLIRWLEPEVVVEIGSFMGFTTAVIAKALDDIDQDGKVYAIDNFSLGTNPAYLHNHLIPFGLANRVAIVPADSFQIDFPAHDLAFIDGNHGLEGVENDVNKSIAAGAFCFILHDTQSWWGVSDFVKKYLNGEYIWSHAWDMIHVPFDEGLAVFLQKSPLGPVKYTKENYPEGYISQNVMKETI